MKTNSESPAKLFNKETYKTSFGLHLTRERAERLLDIITEDSHADDDDTRCFMESIIKDLEEGLSPEYESTMRCKDCGYEYTKKTNERITRRKLTTNGLCRECRGSETCAWY